MTPIAHAERLAAHFDVAAPARARRASAADVASHRRSAQMKAMLQPQQDHLGRGLSMARAATARPGTLFITGASSGIGRALAFEYAKGGARVALAARRAERARDHPRGRAPQRGAPGSCIPLDVTDATAVREAVERADRELGRPRHGHRERRFRRACSTRRESQWSDIAPDDPHERGRRDGHVARRRSHHDGAVGSGHLVGISSLAGRRALPESAAYCASKAALSVFLESLRIDLARAGIRVTDVQPGFVETPAIAHGQHPTPFVVACGESGACHRAAGSSGGPRIVAFPWPLALLTGLGRRLPGPQLRAHRTGLVERARQRFSASFVSLTSLNYCTNVRA